MLSKCTSQHNRATVCNVSLLVCPGFFQLASNMYMDLCGNTGSDLSCVGQTLHISNVMSFIQKCSVMSASQLAQSTCDLSANAVQLSSEEQLFTL